VIDFGQTAACYYCGVPADSVDHVVSRAILRSLADDPEALAALTARGRVLEVDCCRQCNSLLSSDYDQTLGDRKARLRQQLQKRYTRLLETPDWTDSELGRMGPYLQQRIIAAIAKREWIRSRLNYNGAATLHGRPQRQLSGSSVRAALTVKNPSPVAMRRRAVYWWMPWLVAQPAEIGR